MGEKQHKSFQLCFNGVLKVDFQESRATSDGGLILVRKSDEHLGLSQLIEQYLPDSRRGKNTQLAMADLLRQSDGRAVGETCPVLLAFLGRGHLTRRVFAAILRRIWELPLPAG